MIYQINSNQLPAAIQLNCTIIILSVDSTSALIQGDNITGLTIINQYQDNQLNSLLSNPGWRQPCVNC